MQKKIEFGKTILQKLINEGYQAYFVGGFVRDFILNRSINDIDIATDALPERVMELFPTTFPTGIKHGTVTVLIEKNSFEVTTFRCEKEYIDYRHPTKVEFIPNLTDDLSRRDFTMNSIAMDISGKIHDPFNGEIAISKKIIEAVGDPQKRFLEDPLRMLRAIRFAAQLSFVIEKETWEAIKKNASYLKYISAERIKQEMDKIFAADFPDLGLKLLYKTNLVKWMPGLCNIEIPENNYNKTVILINKTNDVSERWFFFFFCIDEKNKQIVMNSLKFSNKEKKEINNIFKVFYILRERINIINLKKSLLISNEIICFKVINILYLLKIIDLITRNYCNRELVKIEQELKIKNIKDLKINGNDLINHFGEVGGPWIKNILEELFKKVVFEGLTNERDTLLAMAKEIKR